MATSNWFEIRGALPSGPVLYSMELIELKAVTELLWKVGRTTNLRRRQREFFLPASPRFARILESADELIAAERDLHRSCPFAIAGRSREFYRATEADMRAWLGVEVACRAE